MKRIQAENLTKIYRVGGKKKRPGFMSRHKKLKSRGVREIVALDGVSFSVEAGTILGVIGPNGAGKTTLLKVLSRISPVTAGRVWGTGRVAPLLEIGMGTQPNLTARENIFLGAALYGIPKSEVSKRFDEIVQFAGVEEFVDMPLRLYSSGMYVRLAFSLAINLRPDILLADEVLAVGDMEFQEKCLERVQRAGREGMTVLFVSHDMNLVSRLCSRTLWLHEGRMMALGDTGEVVSEYQKSNWKKMGLKQKKFIRQHTDGGCADILSVQLTDLGGEGVGAVAKGSDFFVQVQLRTHRPHTWVLCAMDFYTRGVYAIHIQQPEEVFFEEPGIYHVRVRIPSSILAEAVYELKSVSIRCKNGLDEFHLHKANVFKFQVFRRNVTIRPLSAKTGAPPIISPDLDWTTEKGSVHAHC